MPLWLTLLSPQMLPLASCSLLVVVSAARLVVANSAVATVMQRHRQRRRGHCTAGIPHQ